MIRRQLIPAIMLSVVATLTLGIGYPLVVYAIGQAGFKDKANGSLITRNGQVVGSKLIGQSFTDSNGNIDLRYFQPRPSAAGTNGYDPLGPSSATNLGPGDPKLVEQCLPVPSTDSNGNPVLDSNGNPVNETNPDGSPVCNPNTVPQRVLAYRQTYDLPADQRVPVDAVTASQSGLDPDISVANAILQAPIVAKNRGMSVDDVLALVQAHTADPIFGFLGEKVVHVVELNLALDAAQGR
jgi:K+-transporting ATPase ATPase C chain